MATKKKTAKAKAKSSRKGGSATEHRGRERGPLTNKIVKLGVNKSFVEHGIGRPTLSSFVWRAHDKIFNRQRRFSITKVGDKDDTFKVTRVA